MNKTQRLLDPIHGLITFRKEDQVDCIAWNLINTKEFQRLRRIRQLGFSEFVFPNATHTRFTHSIGVYHMSGRILEVVRRHQDTKFDENRARVARIAALLHDVGHGPFSHTFESVEKKRGFKKDHEHRSAEIITGDTEICQILKTVHPDLPSDIERMLKAEYPDDIYHSIVSSQLDADRIDYLLRDRYMAGIESAGFDLKWLLDCLEIGEVHEQLEDDEVIPLPSLCLNHKGIGAAENYILTRFQYYDQLYFHKTTRGAEKLLSALLDRVSEHIQDKKIEGTGLQAEHPLCRYFSHSDPGIDLYLDLDDNVIWSSLGRFSKSSDPLIADFATRLLDRKLFKCADLTHMMNIGGDVLGRFKSSLKTFCVDRKLNMDVDLFLDEIPFNGYGQQKTEEGGSLKQVWVRRHSTGRLRRIDEVSDLIKEVLTKKRLYRVYVKDETTKEDLINYMQGELK